LPKGLTSKSKAQVGMVGIENSMWVLKRKGYYAVGSATRMLFSVLDTLREDFRKRRYNGSKTGTRSKQ